MDNFQNIINFKGDISNQKGSTTISHLAMEGNLKTEVFMNSFDDEKLSQQIASKAMGNKDVLDSKSMKCIFSAPRLTKSCNLKQHEIKEQQLCRVSEETNQHSDQCSAIKVLSDESKMERAVFASWRSRWYTNEEIASILTDFSSHPEWQTDELQIRPKSGAVLLYSREKVRYRQDGYCWKKRKNGRTTREDHMKLKVQGIECIYGCYVHSAILPTFHRRCYWLLQNPDTVLVHYLNQPPDDQNRMMLTFNSSLLESDTRRTWTNDEIIDEIGSVFGGVGLIQHMLDINLPHPGSTSLRQCIQSVDTDMMLDSSPMSIHSQVTFHSETNEQVDMVILNHLQNSSDEINSNTNQEDKCKLERQNGDKDEIIMASTTQDDNNNSINNYLRTFSGSSYGRNCPDFKVLSDEEGRQDGLLNMSLNIVGESNETRDTRREAIDCFTNQSSDNAGADTKLIVGSILGCIEQQRPSPSVIIDQDPCSPVTQIYNKIVDDIETYVLPLDSDQFNLDSRNGLAISAHLLDMSGSDANHQHIQQQRCNADNLGQQVDHLELNQQESIVCDSIDVGRDPVIRNNRLGDKRGSLSKFEQNINDIENLQINQSSEVVHSHPTCSLDLASCDLFDQVDSGQNGTDQNDHGSLLGEFGLQTDFACQANELVDSVTNSMALVDDLSDLLVAISPSDNTTTNHSNILENPQSLELFDFKSSDCEHQQPDTNSTIGNDSLNDRLPLAQVARCNSTSDAMDLVMPCEHNDCFYRQQYRSSNFTTNNQIDPITCGYDNFQSTTNDGDHSKKSSATNISRLASFSPVPRSRTSITAHHQPCRNDTEYDAKSTSLLQFCSKSLLQQRQQSEHYDSTRHTQNLLPKAQSLDSGHFATNGPSVMSNYSINLNPHDQNLIYNHQTQSVTPTMSSQLQTKNQNLDAHHSTDIPLENTNEFLVSTSNQFHRSLVRSMCCQQLAQQNHEPSYQTPHSSINRVDAMNSYEITLPILDYSPNWCDTSGGAKILIIGDWSSVISDRVGHGHAPIIDQNLKFNALFDDLSVPATLIQTNVLRCYAPSHEQGFIGLRILYDDRIVSEQVLFEMRQSCIQLCDAVNRTQNDCDDSRSRFRDDDDKDSTQSQHNFEKSYGNEQKSSDGNSNPQATCDSDFQASMYGSKNGAKVLSLAESILSAMHKKNSQTTVDRLDPNLQETRTNGVLSCNLAHFCQLNYGVQVNASQRLESPKASMNYLESNPIHSSPSMQSIDGRSFKIDHWQQAMDTLKPLTKVTHLRPGDQHSEIAQVSFLQNEPDESEADQSGPSLSRTFDATVKKGSFVSTRRQQTCYKQSNSQHQQQSIDTQSSGLGSLVSSLSPSTTSLHSLSSACTMANDGVDDSSPCCFCPTSSSTPTSSDFCEYFKASSESTSLGTLALSNSEQLELYNAARVIQSAYRNYRGRKRQASELMSAALAIKHTNTDSKGDYKESKLLVDDSSQHLRSHKILHPLRYLSTLKSGQTKAMERAARTIQSAYRRYRRYIYHNHHQRTNNSPASGISCAVTPSAMLVFDKISINTAVTSQVDRKRFKTSVLVGPGGRCANYAL